MIQLDGIHKAFGRQVALDGVGFRVDRGEVVGFVGPNGAGKTTALRILTGFLDADRGRVLVDGIDVARERHRAAARIGYLPEGTPLWGDMRVDELLGFRARIKGIPRADVKRRIDEAVEVTHLGDVRRRLVGRLSKGFRQRVGLADALLARPPVLVLDEPTSGLDPVQVRELRELLAPAAADRTVLLSSHALSEIERVASRVIVLVGGRVVAEGEPGTLAAGLDLPDSADLEDVFVALAERAAREDADR